MKTLHDISLADITPYNLLNSKPIPDIIPALDPELNSVTHSVHEAVILARIDELDDVTLDLLAWQFHADFYDLAGNLKMKREAVKNALIWHMKKGTEWAIHEALRQIGIKADFHPWWETGGSPYTFTLDAIVTDDYYRTAPGNQVTENIRRAVNEAKAARSYLAGLTTKIEFHDDIELYVAQADLLSGQHRIFSQKPQPPKPANFYFGLADSLQGFAKIYPEKIYFKPHDIFSGLAGAVYISYEIGLGIKVMQELLMQFEQRIFARFDEHEKLIRLELENQKREIEAQLEEIKELLTWQTE